MINIDKNLFLNRADNVTLIVSEGRGSGKTWLAQTLAHALTLQGKRVLLFDAGNGLINADLYAGNRRYFYLNDVVDNLCTLNQAVRSLRKKFDVISAETGNDLLENLPLGRLQILGDDLKNFAKNYDNIILDISGSDRVLHNFIPIGSNVILLCNNNPSSLVLAYKFLQKELKTIAPEKVQVIVNYAVSYEEGTQTYNTLRKACEQYIGYAPKLLGIIRNDANVREAIAKHMMLLSDYALSPAAVDVMNIATKLQKGETNET